MKCKSLILGPAAALLVAPSGALAADAMMKDDMGPVTACEAYGSGWFFLPGTETCLKINGNARAEYETKSTDGKSVDEDQFKYRARISFQSQSETEAGTLAGHLRFEANGSGDEAGGTANAIVNWATIYVGGLRLGLQDDYWSTAAGYGYYNAANDGPYSFGRGWIADYSFDMQGFKATAGITQGRADSSASDPDFYAGITYSGGGLSGALIYYSAQTGGKTAVEAKDAVQATNVYTYEHSTAPADNPIITRTFPAGVTPTAPTGYSLATPTAPATNPVMNPDEPAVAGNPGSGGDAWKIRADYDLSFVAPGAKIGGWYMSDSGDTAYVGGTAWGVTGKVGLGDDLTLFVGYGQHEDETKTVAAPMDATGLDADGAKEIVGEDYSHLTVGLTWTPVPGLSVQPEYHMQDFDQNSPTLGDTGTSKAFPNLYPNVSVFNLRIVRSF